MDRFDAAPFPAGRCLPHRLCRPARCLQGSVPHVRDDAADPCRAGRPVRISLCRHERSASLCRIRARSKRSRSGTASRIGAGVAAILRRSHAGILTSFFEGMPCYLLELLSTRPADGRAAPAAVRPAGRRRRERLPDRARRGSAETADAWPRRFVELCMRSRRVARSGRDPREGCSLFDRACRCRACSSAIGGWRVG